jgi:hypothetical protein
MASADDANEKAKLNPAGPLYTEEFANNVKASVYMFELSMKCDQFRF